MSGVDKIIENILKESEISAEKIVSLAKDRAEETVAAAAAAAEKKGEATISSARRTAEEILVRADSLAALEGRKNLLSAKREIIDEVFDRVELYFMQLTGEEYVDFLVFLASGEKGGELIFSEKDKEFSSAVLKKLGEGFVLSRETDKSLKSGYIIKNGPVETKCTVQALIAQKRLAIEPEVAKILFSGL